MLQYDYRVIGYEMKYVGEGRTLGGGGEGRGRKEEEEEGPPLRRPSAFPPFLLLSDLPSVWPSDNMRKATVRWQNGVC